MKKTIEQMDASRTFCPNLDCIARGKIEQGNIVIHGRKRPRYRCRTCEKTFSAQTGTMFHGLRKPNERIVQVVTLLALRSLFLDSDHTSLLLGSVLR